MPKLGSEYDDPLLNDMLESQTSDPAPRLSRADIAKRAALMLPNGAAVNLGIGIPSLCADFVPEGVHLRYQAENGVLGFGELLAPEDGDPDLIDASGNFTKMMPGMAFFDSAESFAMIRGRSERAHV